MSSTSDIGQPVPEKGRPPQAIPSPISRHIITCYVRYQGCKYTVLYIYIYIYIYIYMYIYILVQTITSVQAKLEVVYDLWLITRAIKTKTKSIK